MSGHQLKAAVSTRRRTALACRECRSRKIKCDTIRPICGTCQSHGRHTSCSYENLVERDKRRQAERYIHLLESELSQYRSSSQTGTPDSQHDKIMETQPVRKALPNFNPATTELADRHSGDSLANSILHTPGSHVSNGKRLLPEQETLGSSARSFMAEVQQAPILSSVALFEEDASEPGAKNGFFSQQFHEQIAKFPSLSQTTGVKIPPLTPSWLQHFEDVYFSHVYFSFPFLDPTDWHGKSLARVLTSGASDYNEDLSNADPSALCMVDMVYALGALWSTRLELQQSLPVSERFFLAAKKLVTLDDLETPSLHLAQNLMLITQYCITRLHHQRGFMHASMTYLGLAVRVCRSLRFPSIHYVENISGHDAIAVKLWWSCIYYDVVFVSTCGEPTMVDAREYRIAKKSQLGMKNSLSQRLAFSPDGYFENNVRLSIMLQDLCADLHEASPDYQNSLHASFLGGNFNLLQRHETNLTQWYAELPAVFKLECHCTTTDEWLMLEQRLNLHIRYHYAQTLLYRPAISLLLKLQAKSQSLEVSDDGNFEGSFAQDTLRRFASKCLQAAVHTIDLLFTYRERGRKIMTPVRNFTPLCFYLYNAMLVVIAARCCANDGFCEINLHQKWHQASKIMRYYQVTIRTMELPFQFFEVINERLFQGTDEGEPAANLLQFSESWNMFDWYHEADAYAQVQNPQQIENETAQTVDTMSSQWLGSFLSL